MARCVRVIEGSGRLKVVQAAMAVLLLATACSTPRRENPPASAPAPAAPATSVPAPPRVPPLPGPEARPPPSVITPAPATPAPPVAPVPLTELAIQVESIPAGATIVVDGKPVGKTPLQLSIGATTLGFFRDYVEIRARFVATDSSEISKTAMVEFSPREKVPARLEFTPDGAQRTVR
jgi:hypothetical protein